MFAAVIHFHPSLIFGAKARSLPFEWSPVRNLTEQTPIIAIKYLTRVKVNGSDNLAYYETATIMAEKSFIVLANAFNNLIKLFSTVIYMLQ